MGYLLYGCKAVSSKEIRECIISIEGERISRIWKDLSDQGEPGIFESDGKKTDARTLAATLLAGRPDLEGMDLKGKCVFAGGIDAHVHFREPGMTTKADMESESRAAVLGGVTSFMDMPNTNPPTVTRERLQGKLDAAAGRSYANYSFHLGATNSNYAEVVKAVEGKEEGLRPGDWAGIKIFMGSSTGNMLVDDETSLESFFKIKGKEILVHCEDEDTIRQNLAAATEKFGDDIPFSMHPEIRSRRACILSSIKALELAIQAGTRLHLLHISTKEELEMVRAAKMSNRAITAETSANYLWFSDKDYEKMGSRVKCNPAVKSEEDKAALRAALKDGLIDTIGSDHAPHLEAEKDRPYRTAPSGLPTLQQSLQVLLTVAEEEDIPLTRIASVFSEKAAEMFGIRDRGSVREGNFADLAVVDVEARQKIRKEDIAYRCGWSPYEGMELRGRITDVFVNGKRTVAGGKVAEGPSGQKLSFE